MDAYRVALEMIAAVKPLAVVLARKDRSLEGQLRRAAQSVLLNLAEGRRRHGRDRIHLFRIASGSVAEVRACLDGAVAWGDLETAQVGTATDLIDRLAAMTWRLGR
jgi:four helix bundle protein